MHKRQISDDLTYIWKEERGGEECRDGKWKKEEMGERKEAHRYREQISGSQRQEVKWRQKGKGGQKVQTSSYKIMNSRECNM